MKPAQNLGHTPSVKLQKLTSHQTTSSLPERWKYNRRRAAFLSALFVVMLSGVMASNDMLASYADRWLSARFTVRERLNPPQPDKRIAIVEIDDKSLSKWSEPLILWGGHIADAINQLNRSGARVIALDWTQPIETDSWLHQKNDEKLGHALSQARGVVFPKFIKPDGSGYVLPTPSLLFAVPGAINDNGESSLGLAEAGTLSDDNVWNSTMPLEISKIQGVIKREVTFAGRIALKAGDYENVDELPQKSILINFGNYAGERGKTAPYQWTSLYDVATATKPDPRWKDKIVLIGATYKGCNDFHLVPFWPSDSLLGWGDMRQIPGVEVQAHIVKTLIDHNDIKRPENFWRLDWFFAALLGSFGILCFLLWNWARASSAAIIIASAWTIISYKFFEQANFDLPFVLPVFSLALGSLLMSGYRALSEERQRAQVMKVWGRQQDPRLIDEILANPELRGGEGHEMQVTVLFADLKNFTKTVEMLPPEQAIGVLNRYLSLLSDIILKHGGWVDKYLGDGLMAQWGVLVLEEGHAVSALKACCEIENQLRTLTPELKARGDITFEVRLTLHSGPVIVGAVGSEQRQERTIIGDTVNVTSRLQETAKELGCNFLISETTRAALGESVEQRIAFGKSGEVVIRGRQQPLQVYEVLSENSDLGL